MSDKKVSKVEYAGETLIDLTADTVTPEVLKSGYTAHTASGEQIVGTNQDVDPSSLGNIYRKYSYGKTDGIKSLVDDSSVMKVCEISVKDYSKLPAYYEYRCGSVGLVYKTLFGTRMHLGICFMVQNNQIVGFPESGLYFFDDWVGNIENYVWEGIFDGDKITIVCSAGDGDFGNIACFELLYIDADPEVYEITNVCELIDSDSSISGSSKTFIDLGKEFTKPFTGAGGTTNGAKGWVPAPDRGLGDDYTLVATGGWGRLKALGYYTATANTRLDLPSNKIQCYLVKADVAASLSASLPSTNGQNLLYLPSADANEYVQISFDTTDNLIYYRTRKKVNEVNTWTEWRTLAGKNVLIGTLTAGQTTLEFTSSSIGADSLLDIYTDKYGVNPTNVVSSAGTATLTFEAQDSDLNVKVVIE